MDKPMKDTYIMRRMGRSDENAFNANLSAFAKRRRIPDWFPPPHPLTNWIWNHSDYYDLKQSETSKYTWEPPYDIFLTGDKEKTVVFRWVFLLQFLDPIMRRCTLGMKDSAVRPIQRRKWRDITSGAAFKAKWPTGESAPSYTEDNYWALGLDEIFGTEATAQARTPEALAGNFVDNVSATLLPCGCEVQAIDWSSDKDAKIPLAVTLAEFELLHQFAILDDDLSRDYGKPYGRCSLPVYGPIPNELASNSSYMEKMGLVHHIVWFQGLEGLRGWEIEDLETRREWTLVLSGFLEPLWRKHDKYKNEKMATFFVHEVTKQVVESIDNMRKLQHVELSLLVFWVRALQADFGIIHTEFFPSSRINPEDIRCSAHR